MIISHAHAVSGMTQWGGGRGGGEAGSPSHDTARQSSGEFSRCKGHNSRSCAGFHLVASSIWFIVVTSRLVVSSVHALRKM